MQQIKREGLRKPHMRGDEPITARLKLKYDNGKPHMRGDEPTPRHPKLIELRVNPTCVGMNRR